MFGLISDRILSTLQLTSGESVFRHVPIRASGGHFEHLFVNKLQVANNLHFSCVFGSSGCCLWCQILTVLMLDER